MPDRLSSLDTSYQTGELSLFPLALDTWDSLYEASNNAAATLKQTLSYNGKTIIVDDATLFPSSGLLRVGPPAGDAGAYELIYYGARTTATFSSLVRGFASSQQNQWSSGASVCGSVMSEYHNATKDAIIQIETDLGVNGNGFDTSDNVVLPTATSLNGILGSLESRFLSPKPIFRATPLVGVPGVQVRFQNFSGGDPIRYLWDFGDGATSTDVSPTHTFISEGVYTVKLNLITGLGAQGIVIKANYITVSAEAAVPFFYVTPFSGISIQTACPMVVVPPGTCPAATIFQFVDQTDGPIVSRIWNFGDGTRTTIDDPDDHTICHQYQSPGEYAATLLLIYDDTTLKRVDLPDNIQVS